MHRVYYLVIKFLCIANIANGQYFQQQCDFDLDLSLTDNLNMVMASGTITYHNNSLISLDTIYFHLWANAFNDDYSAFAEQQLKMQSVDFIFSNEKDRGGYEKISIPPEIGQFSLSKEHGDMGFLVLKDQLPPDHQLKIPLQFELKIPFQFSRLGKRGDYIQLAHWFPKPAVFDRHGWHWFPYLSAGEFYSDFGDYNISLSVPDTLNIASTGTMMLIGRNNKRKDYRITADNVIDMAISIHPSYILSEKEFQRSDGTTLQLKIFYDPSDNVWRDSAMYYLESSVEYYEKMIGRYPYPQLSVVQSPGRPGGGMEYPMLVTVSGRDFKTLDYYINHEVGHQWFYGILAFNEREFPYLDEGLTTFYEHNYTLDKRGVDFHTSNFPYKLIKELETPILQQGYLWQKRRGYSESPSSTPAETSLINYGLNAYERAAYAYNYLAGYIGHENFYQGVQKVYEKWKFKHPGLQQLINEWQNISGKDCSWFIPMLTTDAKVDFKIFRKKENVVVQNTGGIKLPFQTIDNNEFQDWNPPLGNGEIAEVPRRIVEVNASYLGFEFNGNDNSLEKKSIALIPFAGVDNTRKKEIYFTPMVTWNYADGLGLGTAIYNSTFPSKKFQYLLAPQYGLSSNGPIGNAWTAFNIYPEKGSFRKIQYKLSAKRYSNFYSNVNDYRTQYLRIVPQISFHLRSKPNSSNYNKITLRSIFINQKFADFSSGGDFVIDDKNLLINQIRYDHFNFNVLNRKEFFILAEQQSYKNAFDENENYIKLSTAFKYQIRYGISHSVNFRLFASGFLKNSQRNSSSFNNELSKGSIALLSQGNNDYTYEEYFLNRQQGDGPFSNQVSSITGGLKDALGPEYNVGLSNDFGASFHISADLPMDLPMIFKIKPFFDLGYYRSKSTLSDPLVGKTIYSGGLMLSYLDGAFEIYLPLFSSSAINNIYQELEENIFQRISFSIDLHRINPWDLIDDLNF